MACKSAVCGRPGSSIMSQWMGVTMIEDGGIGSGLGSTWAGSCQQESASALLFLDPGRYKQDPL